ncbi:hypothetical protein NIES4074_32750 [Cylindrospermum sp. NIES-4074]|nr:hypothetical protein NIES4074_32750 [Cylindrospermum sp. NIES-4074]
MKNLHVPKNSGQISRSQSLTGNEIQEALPQF